MIKSNQQVQAHLKASDRHEQSALHHDGVAAFWDKEGDERRATLERRNAELERMAAQLERDRAEVESETSPPQVGHKTLE